MRTWPHDGIHFRGGPGYADGMKSNSTTGASGLMTAFVVLCVLTTGAKSGAFPAFNRKDF